MKSHVRFLTWLLALPAWCAPSGAAAAEGLDNWPTLVHLDLEMDLSAPPRFVASARATFDDVRLATVPFLLNERLNLTSATTADGAELTYQRMTVKVGRYHREGVVWQVHLGRQPQPDGERVVLDLAYEGDGYDGSEGKDWMGILLLAPDEFRMSKQTIFHPQIPLTRDTPATQPCIARIEALVPAAFEVYVAAAEAVPRRQAPDGTRAVAFELKSPGVLNLFAGIREKRSVQAGELTIDFLVSERHLDMLDGWADEVRTAVSFYESLLGPHSAPRLGVVEMNCRKGSYNWASQGLLMFDWRVFSNGDIPRATIGHEVAHLWFGSTVFAAGPGERFLTEGLAEYSAWRFVEQVRGADASRALARDARRRYLETVHKEEVDPALARVTFGVPGYSDLAYAKGPLVLRHAEEVLGRAAFDAGLRRYLDSHRGRMATLQDFLTALFEDAEVGRFLLPWIDRDGHLHLGLDPEGAPGAAGRWRQVVCPERIAPLRPTHVSVSERPSGITRRFGWKGDALNLAGIGPDSEALLVDPDVSLAVAGDLHWVRRPVGLVASNPTDGSAGVPHDLPRIALTFDRAISPPDKAGLRSLRAKMRAAAEEDGVRSVFIQAIEPDDDPHRLSVELATMNPDREYLVHLAGLETVDGIPVGPVRLRFRTAPSADQERPRVIATEPASGAEGVSVDLRQIRIRFSEPMRPGRGYKTSLLRVFRAQGLHFPGDALGNSHWEEDGTLLVYALDSPLDPGLNYIMPLRGTSFLDHSANPLEEFDLRFRTAAQ